MAQPALRFATLHRPGARDERADPVHPYHAQQADYEHCAGALWRDYAGTRRIEAGVGAVRGSIKMPVSGKGTRESL